MSVEYRLTGTRPDTSAPLWWQSTDPEIVHICETITQLVTLTEGTHTLIYSDDGLKFESIFSYNDDTGWQLLMALVWSEIPTWWETRKTYFENNNHSLSVVGLNKVTNTIFFEQVLIDSLS